MSDDRLRIRLLGPLAVTRDGVAVDIRGRRPRALLSVLALAGGRSVPVDLLVDRIWGVEELPGDVRGSLHTYVRRLRTALGDDAVITGDGGYRLDVEPDAVDALEFVRLIDAPDTSADEVIAALALWRDTPFEEPLSPWLTDYGRPRLVERHLTALERRIDRDMAAGRHADLVAELRELTARHPLRESLWVRRLGVLEASGRRAEALEAFEDIRQRLADELGTDPGPELQQVFAALLAEPPRCVPPETAGAGDTGELPRQLPAELEAFVGRREKLAELEAVAAAGTSRVIVIHGPGGVGKTSLAIRWATTMTEQYPDGQLFVNLRGFGPADAMEPEQALEALLGGIGIVGSRVPATLDARAALLRTMLADRRLILVLDNARNAQHVRPLLPGGENLVVVTSRNQLRGLAAREGASQVAVGYLSSEESVALLRKRLTALTSYDDTDLHALAGLCGHLPLALAVAAERARRQPDQTLATVVGELRSEADRLAAFEAADDPLTDLRAVFSWSYQALDEQAARMFRLLGLHPGGGISADAAAAMIGIRVPDARRLLDRLAEASLVRTGPSGRWEAHDLLLAYARELVTEFDCDDQRRKTHLRLTSMYLHAAWAASILLQYGRGRGLIRLDALEPNTPEVEFGDPEESRAWYDAEWTTLSLIVDRTVALADHVNTYRLVYATFGYSTTHRPPAEVTAMQRSALAAARAGGDPSAEAVLTNMLAVSTARMGDVHRAERSFKSALAMFGRLGNEAAEQMIWGNLAELAVKMGSHADAIEYLDHALRICRSRGDTVLEALSLNHLADNLTRVGRPDEAVEAAGRALEIHRSAGVRSEEAVSLRALGIAFAAKHDFERAFSYLRSAEELYERIGHRWDRAVTLYHRGRAAVAAGQEEMARRSWLASLTIIDEVGEIDSSELTRADVASELTGRFATGWHTADQIAVVRPSR